MRQSIIYGIQDPVTEKIFYIGQTTNFKKRISSHLHDNSRKRKNSKIKSLLNNGVYPLFIEIDSCNLDVADKMECHYMNVFKSFGCNLLNHRPGGKATGLNYVRLQNEKDAISNSLKGRKKTEEHIERSRQGLKEWWKNDSDAKQKQIDRLMAYNSDPFHRIKTNEAHYKRRKIKSSDFILINKLRSNGESFVKIGIKLGVSEATVRYALKHYSNE